MTILLAPLPVQAFKDSNGNPLSGGQLYTYVAGTSTLLTTYTDATGTTPNTNPVILNSRGECGLWLTSGLAYKLVLQDSYGVLIWSVDQVASSASSGANSDIVSLSGLTTALSIAQGGTSAITAVAAADALGAFRRGTIVGTCSQAGGIPTGNIIEAGINANGTYTRYADGTQTCTMSFPNLVAVPVNTVAATVSKSYPAAFIVVPAVSASAAPVTSNDCYGVVSCNVSLGGVTLLIRNGGSVAQDFQTITAVAIGRWF